MTSNPASVDELRQKKDFLIQEFDNLQLSKISPNEFLEIINPIINELNFEQKWKEIIENLRRESLSQLLNNLSTRVSAYNSLKNLGDDEQANIQLNKLKDVASQLFNQIDDVITSLDKKVKQSNSDVLIKKTSKETEIKIKNLSFAGEKRLFVGRKDYLESKIKNELNEPGSRVSLVGPGGSGKSQLAFKALHQYYEKDKIIDFVVPVYLSPYSLIEIRTDGSTAVITNITFKNFVNDIGTYLITNGISPLTKQQFEELDINECKTTISEIFSNKKHSVLYCDNFETISLSENEKKNQSKETIEEINKIFNFLNNELPNNTSVLVTSRNIINYLTLEQTINVSGLDNDEGIESFIKYASPYRHHLENSQDIKLQNLLKTIIKKTGGHPFSIEILAKSYQGGGNDELDKISKSLGEDRENPNEPDERLKSLHNSFSYSISALSPELKKLLPLLAVFVSPFPSKAIEAIEEIFDESTPDSAVNLYNKSLLSRIDSDQHGMLGSDFWLYTIQPALRNYLEDRYKSEISQLRGDEDFISNFCYYYYSLNEDTYDAWGIENHTNFMRRFDLMSLSEGKNDFDQAIEFAENFTSDEKEREEYVLMNGSSLASFLGLIYKKLGQYDKSLEIQNKSLVISKNLNDKSRIAVDYNNIGLLYREKGQLNEALKYHKKALKIDEALNDKASMSRDYNSIGLIYNDKRQLNEALSYYEKSLKIDVELNNKVTMALRYGNIGLIHYYKGQQDDALKYHKKALKLDEELNDKVGMAKEYGNMGLAYYEKGEYDDALIYQKKALDIRKGLNDRVDLVRSYTDIGLVYLMKKHIEKAKESANNAIVVANEFEKKTGTGHPLKNRIDDLFEIINEYSD